MVVDFPESTCPMTTMLMCVFSFPMLVGYAWRAGSGGSAGDAAAFMERRSGGRGGRGCQLGLRRLYLPGRGPPIDGGSAMQRPPRTTAMRYRAGEEEASRGEEEEEEEKEEERAGRGGGGELGMEGRWKRWKSGRWGGDGG